MLNSPSSTNWLENACQLPIGFAQVREDPLLDITAINQLNKQHAKVLMIASGGCTAAFLATQPSIGELTLVDPNLSQLALAQIKLHLLENHSVQERLTLLGHQFMAPQERSTWIKSVLEYLGYPTDTLGDLDRAGETGLDYMGRYEYLFVQLQQEISPFNKELIEIITVPQSNNCSTALLECLHESFRKVFALDNLVALYGEGATQNPAKPFWEHFLIQTIQTLNSPLAKMNPFLSQMLLGQFCQQSYDWLAKPQQKILAELSFLNKNMEEALESAEQSYDFIHLSNALDWLDPQQASSLLSAAKAKLNSGGSLIIRQLNSTLEIPALLTHGIEWQVLEGGNYQKLDRSFFYKRLLIGKKS